MAHFLPLFEHKTIMVWTSTNFETCFRPHTCFRPQASLLTKVWKGYHLNGVRIPKSEDHKHKHNNKQGTIQLGNHNPSPILFTLK